MQHVIGNSSEGKNEIKIDEKLLERRGIMKLNGHGELREDEFGTNAC